MFVPGVIQDVVIRHSTGLTGQIDAAVAGFVADDVRDEMPVVGLEQTHVELDHAWRSRVPLTPGWDVQEFDTRLGGQSEVAAADGQHVLGQPPRCALADVSGVREAPAQGGHVVQPARRLASRSAVPSSRTWYSVPRPVTIHSSCSRSRRTRTTSF